VSGGPTRTVGSILTCDPGEWTGGGTVSFQWLVDGEPVEETGSINPKRFVCTAGHVGRRVSCAVTKTNEHGATTVVTDPVEVVEPGES
jgi:hypothetical protein